jgi:hypothetical protein
MELRGRSPFTANALARACASFDAVRTAIPGIEALSALRSYRLQVMPIRVLSVRQSLSMPMFCGSMGIDLSRTGDLASVQNCSACVRRSGKDMGPV